MPSSEDNAVELLAEEFSLPLVNPSEIATLQPAIAGVDRQFCLDNEMLFYDRWGSSVKAAISDPLELERVDHFSQLMGLDIEPYMAPREGILRAIERIFPENAETVKTPFPRH